MRRLLDPYDALGDRKFQPIRTVNAALVLAALAFGLSFLLDRRVCLSLMLLPSLIATELTKSYFRLGAELDPEPWWERPGIGILCLVALFMLLADVDRFYHAPPNLHADSMVGAAIPKFRELFWLCTVALPGYGALLVMRRARRMSAALAGRQVLALG
ncbi:MAG TPA: hypothetical protein VKT78_04330 [Fimbriimonadaceae bacterium]|nr:hypothetical protein [Fimbriimonadaceae bacterium]